MLATVPARVLLKVFRDYEILVMQCTSMPFSMVEQNTNT